MIAAPLRASALAMLIAAAPAAATAQEPRYPDIGYYEVGALPTGETLTVRSGPSASSDAVGALETGAGPIETLQIVRTGRTEWAEILFEERNAFVALRFLEPLTPPRMTPSAVPVGLICIGTEPFWSLRFTRETEAVWMSPLVDAEVTLDIAETIAAAGRAGRPAYFSFDGQSWSGSAMVDVGWCSDGMSDRDYGWRATVEYASEGGRMLLEGCCRLDRTR